MIAAVHGFALGAGLRTMMSCDLTVAAEGAQFQLVQVSRGIAGAPHWAQLWFAGGGRWANELALTGRRFSAEEALQHGIINRVVPIDQMLPVANDLAEQIVKNPPLSVRCNVRVMRHFADKVQREALYYLMGLKLNQTEDFREASRAFVEKRTPVFHGR
jgi:enoyl-CoA hydratase/carnithine racemase